MRGFFLHDVRPIRSVLAVFFIGCILSVSARGVARKDTLPSLRVKTHPTLDVTVEPGDQWYECGEFPGGLAGSDPGGYFAYEHDTELEVNCWELDNTGELYLKTVEDECFIREYFIFYNETLDITYEEALPRCKPHRPFQAWWGKPGNPDTGGSPDTDLGPCYHCPDRDCNTSDVDYLMLHVYCWLNGTDFNGSNQWWRHAHQSDEYEKCYVPAVIFDRISYNETGSGGRCPRWDKPMEEAKLR